MTRFVYVLPAGRFRWEVRVDAFIPCAVRSFDDLAIGQLVACHGFGQHGIFEVTELADDEVVGEDVDTNKEFRRWWFNRTSDFFDGSLVILSDPAPPEEPQHYRRKAHALIAARAIAIIIGGEVQPHDRRGRIQDPDSYGNDLRETKG